MLANEQVIDGRCERCGTLVEARQLEQWFFRITDYADRLLDDLETVEWPSHVVAHAAQLDRALRGRRGHRSPRPRWAIDYPVFTTRPDTLFGATFFVMAPEHPDVLRLAEGTEHEAAVRDYVNHALTESHEDRGDVDREKTGVPLGRSVDQPGQRRAHPDVGGRLRADGVRHRRDHGGARPRRARPRVRRPSSACRSGA